MLHRPGIDCSSDLNKHKNIVSNVVWILGQSSSNCEELVKNIVMTELIDILIVIFKKYPKDPVTHNSYILLFTSLFKNFKVLKSSTLYMLSSLLINDFVPTADSLVFIIWAFYFLCYTKDTSLASSIISSGRLVEFAKQIKSGSGINSIVVTSPMILAISLITTISDFDASELINDPDIFMLLSSTLQNESFELIHPNIILAFANVAIEADENKMMQLNSGVYHYILGLLLKDNNYAVKNQVCYYISNMSYSTGIHSQKIIFEILQAGYLETLVAYFRTFDEEMINQYSNLLDILFLALLLFLESGESLLKSQGCNPCVLRFIEANGKEVLEKIQGMMDNSGLEKIINKIISTYLKAMDIDY